MCCNKNGTISYFCCGCKLRTGCIVFGCLRLAFVLGWGITGTLSTANLRHFNYYDVRVQVLTVISIVQSVFAFINGLIIIMGTYEKNVKVLWTSFYFEIVWIIFWFVTPFVVAANIPYWTTELIVFGMLNIIFSSCFLIIMRSFIFEIKADNEQDEQKIDKTEENFYEPFPLETGVNLKQMPSNATFTP